MNRRLMIAEAAHLVGDDVGLRPVDLTRGQCRAGARQPVQPGREVQQLIGAARGERQRDGKLVADVLGQVRVRARGDLGGAAAAEFGDRGQFTRRRPGCEPPPGLEHADELVVSDPIQAAGPDVADEPAQRHAGWQTVGDAAGREPRASPGIG